MASAMEELINEAADRKGRQVAITMLEDGLNIDKVVLYSGLTYEEIEKIAFTG
ncbi:MAG: hypothetical protein IJ736_14745 [Firmicutes bacterium]|nr:hypothetical protein [Bacillota bacterium]